MTSLFRSATLLPLCVIALSSSNAMAQQPAAAPAIQVAPMDCVNPGFAPVDKASPDMNRFSKRVEEYKVCVNKYAAANGAKSNEYADQSRAYADAANKAIDDYNAYVTQLNETTKSTKAGTTKN